MKNRIICLASLCLFLLSSCGDMLESIQPFLDEGEIIYVGKPAEFSAYPGDKRVLLRAFLPYGVTQTSCQISWIDPDGQQGNINLPIDRETLPTGDIYDSETGEIIASYPYFEYILDTDLQEGEYQFTAITLDAQGNKSVPVTASGYVYGDHFRNTLANREIATVSAKLVTENGRPVIVDGKMVYDALIAWRAFYDLQALHSEFRYELEDGSFETISVPVTEMTTTIPYTAKYKKGGKIEWKTVYKPVPQAIDEFYTAYSETTLPAN